ncbi:MAG: methionyl-tRNA formyltransferase [Anaerolineales bacterium]
MGFMELRIVFMGSPDFALPTLEGLHRRFNVVGVVSQPDRPAGRGRTLQPPDVKILASALGLPLIQPKSLKEPDANHQLVEWHPDVIVVAAFGQILRENILNLSPYGCVNVHASLLPRWRGAAPVQAAILHDDVTGITIMKMDKGLDTGPILAQKKIQISQKVTGGTLSETLAQLGAGLLVETLPKYILGDIQPQPQNDEEATYAPRLEKDNGLLNFNQPADVLARMVRAYNPWPGTYQFFNGIRLKVINAHAENQINAIPGKRTVVNKQPAWGTMDGVLVLDEVQIAGKSRVSGEAFLNGAKNWIKKEEDMECRN